MKKNVRMPSALLAGLMLPIASAVAHPGHAATDLVAELSSPLSGWDHALVFGTTAALLGLLLRRIVQFARSRRSLGRGSRQIS